MKTDQLTWKCTKESVLYISLKGRSAKKKTVFFCFVAGCFFRNDFKACSAVQCLGYSQTC